MILTTTVIREQFNELVKFALAEQSQLMESDNDENSQQPELIDMDDSAKSPDFFQDNKPSVQKTEQKYPTT